MAIATFDKSWISNISFGISTSSSLDEAKDHGGLFQRSLIITKFFCINKQNPRFFHMYSLLPSPKSYISMTYPSYLYLCSILVNYSKWVDPGSCAKVPLCSPGSGSEMGKGHRGKNCLTTRRVSHSDQPPIPQVIFIYTSKTSMFYPPSRINLC